MLFIAILQERRSREPLVVVVTAASSTVSSSSFETVGSSSKTPSSTTTNRVDSKCNYYSEPSHSKPRSKAKGQLIFEASRHPADREDFEATGNETYVPISKGKRMSYL